MKCKSNENDYIIYSCELQKIATVVTKSSISLDTKLTIEPLPKMILTNLTECGKRITKKIKNIKKLFLSKTPHQKFTLVRDLATFILKFIGCHVMAPNYKPNIVSCIPTFLTINYFSLMSYTIYYYRHEPLQALQSTPILCIIIPVCLLRNFRN